MRLTHLSILSTASFVLIFLAATVYAGDAAKAKRELASAKDAAQSERWDNLDARMKQAEAAMDGLSDAEKAPLLEEVRAIRAIVTKSVEDDVNKRLDKVAGADEGSAKFNIQRATARLDSAEAKTYADPEAIKRLRERVASVRGGEAPAKTDSPATPAPAATAKPELTGDLKTASVRVDQARRYLEQGEPRFAERMVAEARSLLKDVPEAQKASVLADLAEVDRKIDELDLKAQRDEEHRRVDERVSRYVGTAEDSIQRGVVSDSEWIDKSQALLESHDAKTYLDRAEIKKYQDRLAATRAKLKAHNKAVSLERSADTLKELEEKVAADPFKGMDEMEAHGVFVDIKALSDRVRGEFVRVPKDDPEIKAVLDRAAAADAKLEAAAGKWAHEKLRERFTDSWKFSSKEFAGWESESLAPDSASQRRVDGLDKTIRAIRASHYWLDSRETKDIAEKHKDDAVVQAVVKEAQATRDAAGAKLNEAFNAVLAEAERQPMPQKESDRWSAETLASNAAEWFEGTGHKDANVARAKALDEKWKAEAARLERERAETLKRMTDEATAAWAKIEPSVAASRGFDPNEVERWKGKTVKIKGYYNRVGWDFDAKYHYACDIMGVPVAGDFTPRVLAAYQEVQERSQFGIDDHTGWDLIAVVEGTDTIKRRVFTEWKDKDTRETLFKTETYVEEPCVVIRIIGLHTGPLAVGPD